MHSEAVALALIVAAIFYVRGWFALRNPGRLAAFLTGTVSEVSYWLLDTFPMLGKIG